MRRWPLLAALLVASCLLAPPAQAAPAPYTDWAFDVRRAEEAGELARLGELATARPDFARIWFYGQVFDLVTVGLSDEVKATLRPRLAAVAQALADAEPPDPRPLLYLDWAETGRLAELAPRARELQDAWINAVRANQPLPARLAAAEHPEVAQPVFYMLFFRAELASRRLGGDRERALLIQTARRMAEGFALGVGDVTPWRALAGYLGQPGGVPLAGEGVVESQIGGGLNAWLIGDLVAARAGLDAALATARGARGGSILVALVMNGAAHAAGWLGDHVSERALRVSVLQAMRPLGIDNLVALVLDQMVKAHLADRSVDDMVPYIREMRELGDVVMRTGRHLRTLERAAEALVATARARAEAGDFEGANRVLDEARLLLASLTDDAAIAITTPSNEIATVRRARQAMQAELARLVGEIAERRGRFDEARAALGQARTIYEGTLGDPIGTARTDLDLARVVLAAGDADAALGHVDAAEPSLGEGAPVELRARLYLLQGRARLVRGEPARAFANANFGLRALRQAGAAEAHRPLRARLHALAAAALDAAGLTDYAVARLGEALALAPEDREIARTAAVARAEAGDVDGARAALAGLLGAPDPRPGQILDGCLLARAGRHPEAIQKLGNLLPQLTLPHLRRDQIIGRTCLAAAELATGDSRGAAEALRPARALVLEYPDPTLTWRVAALDGQIAAADKQWLDAAGAWRQAMDRFADATAEQAARGATIDLRTLALPAGPSFAAALPGALVRGAARDKGDPAVHHRAALRAADWADRRAVAQAPGPDEGATLPEADRGARAAWARIGALRAVLADEAVVTAERVAATQALREADAALRQAAPALADADPRLAERRSPAPRLSEPAAGEVVLRYWIEPDAGHLWILEPGKAPAHYDLPGAAKLAAALAPARAAIEEAPAAWPAQKRGARDPNAADWKALATAARVALPFVGDAKVMAALGAARVRVVPHGPLVGFPLDALVVEAPRGKVDGAAPAFVGAALHLTYSLPPRLPAADRGAAAAFGLFGPPGPGATCPVERCAGPDPAADALAAAMRDVEGFARVDGPAATREALGAALMGTSTLLLAAPADPAEAAFVTAPAPGEDGYGRFGGAALAATPAAADAVVVLHPAWSTWPALDAALRAAGVEVAIGAVGAVPAAAAARLGARLASGTPIRSAVLAVKRDGLTAQVDPEVGGEAGHHPYFWARWLVFGEPVDRAALEAAIKPLPAPPVAPIDPYGSDAAAPGGGAAPEAAPVDPYDAGGAAPAEDAPPVDPYGEAAPVGDGG